MRRALFAAAVAALVLAAGAVTACREREVGYFSPQFTPDGAAIVVIVREASATVLGPGIETFTPPARSQVSHDRFSLVRIRLSDRATETLAEFRPAPTEGRWFEVYRPRVFGSARAHLRWAAPATLEYEIGISIPRQPTSETWVLKRRWTPGSSARVKDEWRPGSAVMGGIEPSQVHGAREVVAVAAGGAMACAVVVVNEGKPRADPLIESPSCRKRYPDGYAVAAIADSLRRADIERVALLKSTHERLVAEGRAGGLGEGDAALEAIRGMQRLGFYPKPPMLVARKVDTADPSIPVFAISDIEFQVGLFPDLRSALDHPGEDVEKSGGQYIIHRDFDTSRQLNAHLQGRGDVSFQLRADGALWLVRLDRP